MSSEQASTVIFWLADNVDIWKPVAVGILAAVVLACLLFARAMWEALDD